MKKFFQIGICLVLSTNVLSQQFVDTDTPTDAKPQNNSIVGNWKLEFSDEFITQMAN